LEKAQPLEAEMITEMFLLDKKKCELLKLDRMHVRVAKTSSDWDVAKDDLPNEWSILYRGQWDSKISEE